MKIASHHLNLRGGDDAHRSAPIFGRSHIESSAIFLSAPRRAASPRPGRARPGAGWVKLFLFAVVAFAPARMLACAACGSENPYTDHSAMVDGMNLAILTLGAVLLPVLGAFLFFLIRLIRKSEALAAAAERRNSPEPEKI